LPTGFKIAQSIWELCDQSGSDAGTLGAASWVFFVASLDLIRDLCVFYSITAIHDGRVSARKPKSSKVKH